MKTGWKSGLVCLLLAVTPAAHAGCFSVFKWIGDGTPRGREKAMRSRMGAVAGVTTFLSGIAGRHLTATEAEKRRAVTVIDAYLYIGDIGPVVKLYNNLIRDVELAKLSKDHNLQLLGELETLSLDAPAGTIELLEAEGLLNAKRKAILESGTPEEKQMLVTKVRNELLAENLDYERTMGRHFEMYKTIRKHIAELMKADAKLLLATIGRTDSRSAVERKPIPKTELESVPRGGGPEAIGFEVMQETPRGVSPAAAATQRTIKPGDPFAELKAHNEQVDRELAESMAKVDKFMAELETWIKKLRPDAGAAPDLDGLSTFLGETDVDGSIRAAIASAGSRPEERMSVIRHLELMRARLRDGKQLLTLAVRLDRSLGAQTSDFQIHRHLYPSPWIRPTVEQIQRDVYASAAALRARGWSRLRAELVTVVDSVFFYGWTAQAVPFAGRASKLFGLIKSEAPRNFVYGIFKNLYNKHIVDQHFPALTFLRQSTGTVDKLLDLVENLNAGTHDELLVTFSRRADMREMWGAIKDEAYKRKDIDHLKLYDRMVAAEKRGEDLGTLSAISQDSRVRYLVSTLLNGAIFYYGKRWVSTGSDDDDKKKKKEAPAEDMPKGGDEKTEEKAYAAAGTLLRLIQSPDPITAEDQRTAEAAARALSEAEAELRGAAVK